MDWIDVAKDRNRSWSLVNAVMNFPQKKDCAPWSYSGISEEFRLLQYYPMSEFRRRLLPVCYDTNICKIRGPLPAAKFLGTEINFPCWNACFRYSFCPAWQHLSWPPPAEGPCSHSQARQPSQWRRLVFVQVSKTHILHLSSPCTKRPIWQTRKCLKCLHCYYTQTNFPHSVWKTCSSEFCAHAGTITGLWAVTWCHCVCRDLWRGAALCVSRIVPRLHWMCRNLWRGVTEFVATCSGVTVCVATGDAVQLCVCRELCHGITECVTTCDVVSLFVSRLVTRCHCVCKCVSRLFTQCHCVCREL